MGALFPAVELNNAIRFSTLSRMSVFLWHSSKWAHGFGRFLQYMSGLEVLACSFDTDLNNAPTAPFFEPLSLGVYVACSFDTDLNNAPAAPFFEPLSLWVYSQRQILCNASSALSWTRRPLLYFPTKCLNV